MYNNLADAEVYTCRHADFFGEICILDGTAKNTKLQETVAVQQDSSTAVQKCRNTAVQKHSSETSVLQ